MQQLIERIRERLKQSAYVNEAAISHGVVMPIVAALGWDTADPLQVVPEFPIEGRGRADFALFGVGRKPSIIIEVKGVGRAVEADRQLFEYAFHQGVPLCVLTDGREWSFYLPGGQGSYEDRRVYRLQLDDREPAECERILWRYMARERVRDQSAFEDAQRDHRDAAGRREAQTVLPKAWADLVDEVDGMIVQIVADKAEALCGFRPAEDEVRAFLRKLALRQTNVGKPMLVNPPPVVPTSSPARMETDKSSGPRALATKTVSFRLRGERHESGSARQAVVDLLRLLIAQPGGADKISELSEALRTKSLSIVDRSPELINPNRPDLADAADIGGGWMIGLRMNNRSKMGVIRTAAKVYGLRVPEDLDIALPNGG